MPSASCNSQLLPIFKKIKNNILCEVAWLSKILREEKTTFIAKNVTFLHRKWISPRKLIPAQGKVFPRAVFTPRGSALQPRAKRGL